MPGGRTDLEHSMAAWCIESLNQLGSAHVYCLLDDCWSLLHIFLIKHHIFLILFNVDCTLNIWIKCDHFLQQIDHPENLLFLSVFIQMHMIFIRSFGIDKYTIFKYFLYTKVWEVLPLYKYITELLIYPICWFPWGNMQRFGNKGKSRWGGWR